MLSESGETIEFDSYLIPESDLEIGQLRLLDVDQRLVVPVDTHVRYIVTGDSSRPKFFLQFRTLLYARKFLFLFLFLFFNKFYNILY